MVINSPCLTDKKELVIPRQMATGKELSNSLMAGSLPKTTLPTKCHNSLYAQLQTFKTLSNSLPTQTLIQFTHRSSKPIAMSTLTFAKTHNLIAYLGKPTESEGFEQIIDFSMEARLSLARMGYEKPSNKLTFYKAFVSPQWKFLIQTILQCLSAKTTSCNEFSNTMASAIICLATNQKFNFSRYILLSLVKNIEDGVPFFMFPMFVQLIINHQLCDMTQHKDIFDTPSLTKKVFANIKKRKCKPKRKHIKELEVPLTESQAEHNVPLPSPSYDPLPSGEDSLKLKELKDLCTNFSNKILDLESEMIDIKSTYKAKIKKLESMVERLEDENRVLKKLKGVHSTVVSDEPIMKNEESLKQGRKITGIDADVEINLEKFQAEAYNLDLDHQEKVLSMLDVNDEEPVGVEEVLEVVKTAKLITKVVTTTGVDVNNASVQDTPITAIEETKVIVEVPKPKKRRCVIIQDPEDTKTTVTVQPKVQAKDKGKAILIKEPKPLKRQVQIDLYEEVARQLEAELNADINWHAVIEQVKRSERLTDAVMKYQALKRKPLTEAQTRRNMIVYLKNMFGYKMNYFKGMSYDEIRPLFKKHYNYNQAFLNEVNERVKFPEKEVRQEKEVKVESSKRECESLEQEIAKKQKIKQETGELKKCLHIVPDDDDDVTIIKNFDREDLESLRKIIKRFEKTEPKNYTDDYLLNNLKIMFEKPNVEANIFLLVEKMYPLTHFTIEQMVNDVRLEVNYESEMSLELLRLVRRQLNEGIWRHVEFLAMGEAVRSAAYLMNRTPSQVIDFKTPLQKLQELMNIPISPGLEPRVFGCTAYVHQNIGKLEPRAIRCVFLGYVDKKGYRCLDPKNQKMYVTRDVSFHENVSFFSHECSLQGEKTHNLDEETRHETHVSQDGNNQDENGTSLHEPNSGSSENLAPEITDYDSEFEGETNRENEDGNEHINEPNGEDITNESRDSTHLVTNPVENPKADNPLEPRYPTRHNRGILKKQYQPDLKANTKYPIGDYVSSYRLARSHALLVEELSTVTIPKDVQKALKDEKWKNAMNEKMEALRRNQTWKLVNLPPGKKTKYGIDYGDTFAPVAKINTIRVLISIAANRDWPLRQFDVKNSFLNGYLEEVYMEPPLPPGGHMRRPRRNVTAPSNPRNGIRTKGSWSPQILLRNAQCRPVDTPIETNHKLMVHPNQVPTNKDRYQRLVGKLIYLSHTRPDVAYAVSVVSRFMHSPSKDHMEALYRILRYLKGSPGNGLFFEEKKTNHQVSGYTDADSAGDRTYIKPTSGYFTFIGGNLITWRSNKQKVVARSSAEAEYRGMVHGVCELLWIK
uniref:Putative RNA-directed DNA polymerase n=1 Tax=Tanacetum cinerariifolium TaxID=118510 RepID=A0A699HZ06_TANCI|nr:putative RNA-directed DNA polymerase [Tanacetum cinerariifolium]